MKRKKSDDGTLEQVAILKSGDYFGEQALLTDDKRSATITTKSELECLTLSREDFSNLLGKKNKPQKCKKNDILF